MFDLRHSRHEPSLFELAERDELVRELHSRDEGILVTATHTVEELRGLLSGMDEFPISKY